MTDIIGSLAEISDGYDVVFCDLWGCYHNGVAPHEEAVAALRAFRARGGTVALMTNAPRPHGTVARQLAAMGAPEDSFDLIVTSGDATADALKDGGFGTKCHHVGPDRDLDLLEEGVVTRVPLKQADFILCTGLFDDSTETPKDYRALYLAGLSLELPMVCANPDVVVDRGTTRIFCAGGLAEAYEERGGDVHYFGKPHRPIYDLAFARIAELRGAEVPKSRILAIGDGPSTDIRGGEENGIDTVFIAGGLAASWVFGKDGTLSKPALEDFLGEACVAPQKTLAFLR